MTTGIPQAAVILPTLMVLYTMDFRLSRRYDRQSQASGPFRPGALLPTPAVLLSTNWDFTRALQQKEVLFSQALPGYLEYARRTPGPCRRIGEAHDSL